jgi:hypothetical protein
MCAVDVADWTQERHDAGTTWLFDESDFTGLVDSLIAAGYPFASWDAALKACRRIQHVHQYQDAAEVLVSAGYAGEIGDMPLTAPEKQLEGRRNTLLSLHVNVAPVEYLTKWYIELSIAASKIAALRSAAFLVDGRIQWPQLEWNQTAWWVNGVRRPEEERTAELVYTPVFHLA